MRLITSHSRPFYKIREFPKFGITKINLIMAKQAGHSFFTGTLNNLTGRKLKNGEYVVGKKSSLDKKRVLSDPAFEGSIKSANRFARGQEIARTVYHKVVTEKGHYPIFVKLRSQAILLLKDGVDEKEVTKKITKNCKSLFKNAK